MIRSFLLLSIGASLYANSEYIPFSKFSQTEQIKHNFQKAEVDNFQKVQEVHEIKKTTPVIINEKTEIKKPTAQIKQKHFQKQKAIEKTKYKKDILYSARVNFSPLTADYSNSLVEASDESNLLEPSGSISFGEHKIEASYFKSKNEFYSAKLETTWYKLAYKHKFKNANIGIAANHLAFESNASEEKETFPSLEVDFKNSSGILDLEYGASLGKNKNIEYAYEYFINLNVKAYENSNQAIVFGYKNRTIQLEKLDEKVEFTGPFVGVDFKF